MLCLLAKASAAADAEVKVGDTTTTTTATTREREWFFAPSKPTQQQHAQRGASIEAFD